MGRSATEVLGGPPGIIGGLNFRDVRWNGAETFSRPFAGSWPCTATTTPVLAAGVPSGTTTRLLRNSATPVAEVSDRVASRGSARRGRIEIDVEKRREAIWSAAIALADGVNGVVPPGSASPAG